MYKEKKILAIIPARGGSKGLPGKNTRPLLDKPLIAWTIEQALSCKYLDTVMVNTDDKRIAVISNKYGAEVPYLRPGELATDDSKVIDTVIHTLDFYDSNAMAYDYVCLLEPTSPLRKDGDIDNAIEKLVSLENQAESVISLGQIALEHPLYAKKVDEQGYVSPFFELKENAPTRQTLPTAYFPYGVVYLSKVSAVRKFRAVYPDRIVAYLIERWQNYEINDEWDFACVEAILKRIRDKKGI